MGSDFVDRAASEGKIQYFRSVSNGEAYAKGGTWLEQEHPRDSDGEFKLKGGPSTAPKRDKFESLGGKQNTLFQTRGEPGQMNLFADKAVPDALLSREQREKRRQEEEAAKVPTSIPSKYGDGEIVTVPNPFGMFSEKGVPMKFRVLGRKGGKVYVDHGDREALPPEKWHFGAAMPEDSIHHFFGDISGQASYLPPSDNPYIEAVRTGKAEPLGKGDDGVAFGVGDKVVKMSTTVPFHPFNQGHRSANEAMDMLAEDFANAKMMRNDGVPGIPPQSLRAHGDKAFVIMPRFQIPDKFTPDQLEKIKESIEAMHAKGWVLRDQIQVGLDDEGNIWHFDTGKAMKSTDTHDREHDIYNLKSLYSRSGVEWPNKAQEALDNWDNQFGLLGDDDWEDLASAPDREAALEFWKEDATVANKARKLRILTAKPEQRDAINQKFLGQIRKIGLDPAEFFRPDELGKLMPAASPVPEKPVSMRGTDTTNLTTRQKRLFAKRYAKDDEGGTATEPKPKQEGGWRNLGGAPVFVGPDGIILKGCPGLRGRHIDHLDDTQDERAAVQEQAEQEGWTSAKSDRARETWQAFKDQHPDHPGFIGLVRHGGKFHTFGDDAKKLHDHLGIGDGETAEFDEENLHGHMERLVEGGHRIAVIDRDEESGAPDLDSDADPEAQEAVSEAHEDMQEEQPEQPAAEPPSEIHAAIGKRFGIPAETVKAVLETHPDELAGRDNYMPPVSGRDDPVGPTLDYPKHPLGTPKIDSSRHKTGETDEAYVDYLREFDPNELKLSEHEDGMSNSGSVQAYTDWARAGMQAPPISVFDSSNGNGDLVSTNRRRVLAARQAGQKITGWHGATNPETGLPLKFGDVKRAFAEMLQPHQQQLAEPVQGSEIPRVTNEEAMEGNWDQWHAGLGSEMVMSKMASGMKGIEGREYAIREHAPGKWQMISRPLQKPAAAPQQSHQIGSTRGWEDIANDIAESAKGDPRVNESSPIAQGGKKFGLHWMDSEHFTLQDIPIESIDWTGAPEKQYGQSKTQGPIVIDSNRRDVGGEPGRRPKTIVLDGQHRLHEARQRGDKTIKAWVGDKAAPHLQPHVNNEIDNLANEIAKHAAETGSNIWKVLRERGITDNEQKRAIVQKIVDGGLRAKHSPPAKPPSAARARAQDSRRKLDDQHAEVWNRVIADPQSASPDELRKAMQFASHLHAQHGQSVRSGSISKDQHSRLLEGIDAHVARIQQHIQARRAGTVPGSDAAGSATNAPGAVGVQPTDGANPGQSIPESGGGSVNPGSVAERHSATGQHIARAPKRLRGLFESLHKLRDTRRTGTVRTTELGHDFAKKVYDHFHGIGKGGDKFGEVHDLSEEVGHGAIGYSSRAGNLVIVPPKFKGEDWDVRYTLPHESQLAPPPAKPKAVRQPREPKPAAAPKEPKAPAQPKVRGVNPKTRLGAAIISAVGEDPADQSAFKQLVDSVWEEEHKSVNSRNDALRNLLAQFGIGGRKFGLFSNELRKHGDADSFMRKSSFGKKFDQIVEYAQKYHPELLSYTGSGEIDAQDAEDALFQRLQTGLEMPPKPWDDSIISMALEHVQSSERSGKEHEERMANDPEYKAYIEDLMSRPFARRGVKIRYRRWLGDRLSRWRKYARQLGFTFSEDDHPRAKEPVTIGNTKYTPGEWIPKDKAEQATPAEQEKIAVVDNETGEAKPMDEAVKDDEGAAYLADEANYDRRIRGYGLPLNSEEWEKVGYDRFKKEYTNAFNEMVKYGDKAGAKIFTERMEQLANAKPEWADRAESEEPPKPEPVADKPPWQLSRADWHKANRDKPGYEITAANRAHKQAVSDAIDQGAEVPPEAYADYPDLKERAENRVVEPIIPEQPEVKVATIGAQQRLFDAGIVSEPPKPEAKAVATTEAAVKKGIEDFGEKIGGARKDTATKGVPRHKKATVLDDEDGEGEEDEAWKRRYIAMKSTKDDTWRIYDKGKKANRYGMVQLASRETFNSEAEAEAAIPLIAVARNHRVANLGTSEAPNYAIYRQVTDRKRATIKDGFATYDDAMRYMAQNPGEICKFKTRIDDSIHPMLERVERSGRQHRENDRPAQPEDFKIFGFRGVEFGNWNNQAERQHILNHAYDSMMDLADALNMPPSAVSLNGELALAFGARGHGLQSARAHYEPDYSVINLTKLRGAGSLAHEWYHALEHYIGRRSGMSSSNKIVNSDGDTVYSLDPYHVPSEGFTYNAKIDPELKEAFKEISDKITHRKQKYVEDESLHERRMKKQSEELGNKLKELRDDFARDYSGEKYTRYKGARARPASPGIMAEVDALTAKILAGDIGERVYVNGRYSMPKNIARLSELFKEHRGNMGFYKDQSGRLGGAIAEIMSAAEHKRIADQLLADAKAVKEKERKVHTDYYSQAKRLDNGATKDYWSSPKKLAARAFESYVYDKLTGAGGRNDFLAYEKHNNLLAYRMFNVKPFPEKEERDAINSAFEKLVGTLQPKDFGVAGDRPAPVLEAPKAGGAPSSEQPAPAQAEPEQSESAEPQKQESEATKQQSDAAAVAQADKWHAYVTGAIKELRDKHSDLLLNKKITERFRVSVAEGRYPKEKYDADVASGRLLNDEQLAKAKEIEDQIEQISNTPMDAVPGESGSQQPEETASQAVPEAVPEKQPDPEPVQTPVQTETPPPTEPVAPAAPAAVAKHRPDIDKEQIFAQGVKRGGFSPPSISANALKGANAIWYHQGDYNQTRFAAAQRDATDWHKKKSAEMDAAYKAGYRFVNHRAGKYGTLWVLEKDGRVLTQRGMDSIMAGTASVDAPEQAGRETAKPIINAVSSFVNSLPESTQNNFGALVAAFNRSPLGHHVTLGRDSNGYLRLSDKNGTWHIFEPQHGHDSSGEFHKQLETSLPRFLAKLDHMSKNEIPAEQHGWVDHDRQADSFALGAHPPGGGASSAPQVDKPRAPSQPAMPGSLTDAASMLQSIRDDMASMSPDDAESLLARTDAIGSYVAQHGGNKPLANKLLQEAHSVAERIRGGSGKPGVKIDYTPEPESSPPADEPEESTATFDPSNHIKIAADSIGQLRQADVWRVLDSVDPEHRGKVYDYVTSNRPDLKAEADDVMDDLNGMAEPATMQPAAQSPPEPTPTPAAPESQDGWNSETIPFNDGSSVNRHYSPDGRFQVNELPDGQAEVQERIHGGAVVQTHGRFNSVAEAKAAIATRAEYDAQEDETADAGGTVQEKTPAIDTSGVSETFNPDKHGGYQPLIALAKQVRAGEVPAEQYKQQYAFWRANAEPFMADLVKRYDAKTLKNIAGNLGSYHARTASKQDNAKSIYQNLLIHAFHTGSMFQYGMDGPIAALDKHVAAQTDDSFAKYRQESEAENVKAQEAIKNPKTLSDFSDAIRHYGGYDKLPEEHKAAYDNLHAEKRREGERARKATVAAFTAADVGDVGIVEGHHQKHNKPTYTVTVQNELPREQYDQILARSRQLGGNYVNKMIARRYNATPGFQFFSRDAAQKFAETLKGKDVDRSDVLDERRVYHIDNAGDRLQAMAELTRQRAQEKLNAPRQTNTARRAEMAASANAQARSEIAKANTLAKIAEGLKADTLTHLSGIRAKTHLDALDSALHRAKWTRYSKLSYRDWEKAKEEPYGSEDVNAVKYPYPAIWASEFNSHIAEFEDVPGLKNLARSLKKTADVSPYAKKINGFTTNGGKALMANDLQDIPVAKHIIGDKAIRVHASQDPALLRGKHPIAYTADKGKTWGISPEVAVVAALNKHGDLDLIAPPQDQRIEIKDEHTIGQLAKAVSKLKRKGDPRLRRIAESMAGSLEDYNRLQSMDIKSVQELRAALREYLPLKAERDREDPVKVKERALVGTKIPGFFPTPRPLIDSMIAAADIQPGHTVLEPSAGKGDILDAVKEHHPDATAIGIEPVYSLRDIIATKGHELAEDTDFLEHRGQYDRIVMNPPFENRQDVAHVRHAYENLKPGGRLVAIMSAGPFHGSNKADLAFQQWLEETGAEIEDNPEKSFAGSDAFRQTGVNTKLVVIEKP